MLAPAPPSERYFGDQETEVNLSLLLRGFLGASMSSLSRGGAGPRGMLKSRRVWTSTSDFASDSRFLDAQRSYSLYEYYARFASGSTVLPPRAARAVRMTCSLCFFCFPPRVCLRQPAGGWARPVGRLVVVVTVFSPRVLSSVRVCFLWSWPQPTLGWILATRSASRAKFYSRYSSACGGLF